MEEICPCLYQYRACGVCPLGDQVRLRFGMSRKPLSSRKTRCAPNRLAFFYIRPAVALPAYDLPFVPLKRPVFRLLAAPTQSIHYLPDMAGMIRYGKVLLDQPGDPLQGPQLGGMASGQRAFHQEANQPLLL